jgi:hypothetical protein
MLNKRLNQNMLYLELDSERNSRNILSIAEALAKENDKVRTLLVGLQRHQQEYAVVAEMEQHRKGNLRSVRDTLKSFHTTRESLAHAIEEAQPEADAAKRSNKRPLPLASIMQLSKRVRYTTAWPTHHSVPPPHNTKALPPPYSHPAPQEDHMKHFSLLFDSNKYAEKEKAMHDVGGSSSTSVNEAK